MPTRKTPTLRTPQLLVAAAAIWTCAVSCAAVKLAIPHFEWWVTALFVVLALPFAPKIMWSRLRYTITWGTLLSLGIALVAFNATNPAYQLVEAAKIAVILLVVLPLLCGSNQMARATAIGAQLACYLNTVLLIFALCGFSWAGGMQALDRYGTVLNPPGSLWRIGLMTLAIGPLSLVTKTSSRPRAILLTVCSLTLLAFDGSRTGSLILWMLGGFIVWVASVHPWANAGKPRRPAIIALLCMAIPLFAFVTMVIGRGGMADIVQSLGMSRISEGLTSGQDASGLLEADRLRSQMWHDAIDRIESNPVIGKGMGTTVSGTAGLQSGSDKVPATMTVHVSYLQVWADAGILAAVSYLMLLVVGPFRSIKRMPRICASQIWAIKAGGIFLLAALALAGLFHPLSTELSEWVAFIVAVGGVGFTGFRTPKEVITPYVRSFERSYSYPQSA